MIKALIFDCFGVLYQGIWSTCLTGTRQTSRRTRDAILALDYGYISYDDYLQKAAVIFDTEPSEIKRIVETHHLRNSELFAFVENLAKNYKLGLLSNAGQGVIEALLGSDLELFDTITVSSDLGIIKPSLEIYEYTAKQLELPPKECLFIDDMQRNVEGAQAAGMQAIKYDSYRQLKKALQQYEIVHA